MAVTVQHQAKAGALLTGTEWESASTHIVGGSVDGVVPVGGIIMWSGTIATIPATWALCDGTLNSPGPDLRDKFVVGATQDQGGIAKTNIEGSLKQSATQTGASVADHTNLTHDGSVASHPDLTHVALSHPALTVVHADHSLASVSHTHASGADVSVPSGSFASTAGVSVPSASFTTIAGSRASRNSQSGVTITGTVTRSVVTTGGLVLTLLSSNLGGNMPSLVSDTNVTAASHAHASAANASAPSGTIASVANASRPTTTGSEPAVTVTHADHSLASLSHQAIGTHANLSHAFTPPTAHGTAGTVTHSTVAIVPAYFALAFIQRMS